MMKWSDYNARSSNTIVLIANPLQHHTPPYVQAKPISKSPGEENIQDNAYRKTLSFDSSLNLTFVL